MFESLREWCRFPVYRHEYNKPGVSGDSSYKAPQTIYGYRVDKLEVITNKEGKEYASKTQIYLPEEVSITIKDRLSFESDTSKQDIQAISRFSDGSTGLADMKVVYL